MKARKVFLLKVFCAAVCPDDGGGSEDRYFGVFDSFLKALKVARKVEELRLHKMYVNSDVMTISVMDLNKPARGVAPVSIVQMTKRLRVIGGSRKAVLEETWMSGSDVYKKMAWKQSWADSVAKVLLR